MFKKFVNKNFILSLLRRETVLFLLVSFLAIFLSKFPALYLYFNTPEGYWFLGHASWFDAWDVNSYIAHINYGQNNGILLENEYTSLPHKAVLIFPFYTLLGFINRFLELNTVFLFQISSVIASIILIFIYYKYVKYFLKKRITQIFAFAFILLGGGFGFYFFEKNIASADFNYAGFSSVYAFERGHDAISTFFYLTSIFFSIKFLTDKKKIDLVIALTAGFFNLVFHPPFIAIYIIYGVILSIWIFIKKREIHFFIYPLCLLIFFSIYYFLVLSDLLINPGFSGITTQSLFPASPDAVLYGLGLIAILIFLSLITLTKSFVINALKILFIVQLLLLFSPIGSHLYYLKGLYAIGIILGFWALELNNLEKFKTILFLILILSSISRFYIFNSLLNASTSNPFYFLEKKEANVLLSMRNFQKNTNVLSLYFIGNYIPAFTRSRVFFGHKLNTPNGSEKETQTSNFYLNNNRDSQIKFLEEERIDYIYYGNQERRLRLEYGLLGDDPFPYFKKAYNQDGIIVYKSN